MVRVAVVTRALVVVRRSGWGQSRAAEKATGGELKEERNGHSLCLLHMHQGFSLLHEPGNTSKPSLPQKNHNWLAQRGHWA